MDGLRVDGDRWIESRVEEVVPGRQIGILYTSSGEVKIDIGLDC
jgi:hypothetical protein